MTTTYYEDEQVQLHLDTEAGCLAVLPTLPDASVDAIVCDPPYELGFMGHAWDASGIAYNVGVWRECLRVLKPGGHLAAFGGTRTYHRMACAIEDAGFEIRDSLHWLYGTGFPKGIDVAKALDRRRDDRNEVLRATALLAELRDAAGWTNPQIDALWGFDGMAGHWTTQGKAATVPTVEQWELLRVELGCESPEFDELVLRLNGRKGSMGEAWAQREVLGQRTTGRGTGRGGVPIIGDSATNRDVTASASDAARAWEGWNTALKPAHEPIVLARKSTGFNTTAANLLERGTGALNVDGCRTSGRWPTNLVLSHPPLLDEDGGTVGDACADECVPGCPVAEIDRQSGVSVSSSRVRNNRISIGGGAEVTTAGHDDQGGASRFFPAFRYEAKAPASERPRLPDGTAHPTVKPLALMRWLVRLVTPPGGLVADPFAGTGTTGEAAALEDMHALLIERDPVAAELCRTRLSKPRAIGLFTDDFGGAA